MLNAKQMTEETRAFREADSKDGLRLLTWHAIDTERKTPPARMLSPDPATLSEKHLIVQSGKICFRPKITDQIDLTAPDADKRLGRYVETKPE